MKLRLTFVAALALAMIPFSQTLCAANDDPSAALTNDCFQINLWNSANVLPKLSVPETATAEGRGGDATHPDRFTKNVSVPTITVFLPKNATAPTPMVVICPGGGYAGLAIDKEGYDVARFLVQNGIAGIVLKYRLPSPLRSVSGSFPLPMQDMMQAMQVVAQNAAKWNIDPKGIGVMGFSAGGHLAAWDTVCPVLDMKGGTLPHANFAALIYPVISMEADRTHMGSRNALLGAMPAASDINMYSVEEHVNPQTPPIFLVCAADDPAVNPKTNALLLKKACDAAGVPCELHEFARGGHGFGMGVRGGEVAQWPQLFVQWLHGLKH